MRRRKPQRQIFIKERLGIETRRGECSDSQVEFFARNGPLQFERGQRFDLDLQTRRNRARHNRREQIIARAFERADANRFERQDFALAQCRNRLVHFVEHALGIRSKSLARDRELNAARAPVEKRRAQFVFELLDLLTERWLRNVEFLGRTREVRGIGDRQKIAQVTKFHAFNCKAKPARDEIRFSNGVDCSRSPRQNSLMDYVLAELPAVHRVEVLRLARKDQYPTVVRELEAKEGVRVEGEIALEIAQLWRQLPLAEQMRCHHPPFALRFYEGNTLILTASLCWGCNNIAIIENGQSKYARFAGRAEVSKQLLHLLERLAPET